MKLKIYVKYIDPDSAIRLNHWSKGDWIDLRARVGCSGENGTLTIIPLGVAMKLPAGFEAIIAPRSSTPSTYGFIMPFIMPNSIGIIDNSYQGNNDEWKCPALFFDKGNVPTNTRICQFRIQLSQGATVWQKLKWLFSSGIELVEVESLTAEDRGGLGSSGAMEYKTI